MRNKWQNSLKKEEKLKPKSKRNNWKTVVDVVYLMFDNPIVK